MFQTALIIAALGGSVLIPNVRSPRQNVSPRTPFLLLVGEYARSSAFAADVVADDPK